MYLLDELFSLALELFGKRRTLAVHLVELIAEYCQQPSLLLDPTLLVGRSQHRSAIRNGNRT
eukprot:7691173-Lingulodinium_polyedra.AAC.1